MTSTINHILTDPVAQHLLTSKIPARLAYCWKDGTPESCRSFSIGTARKS